MTPMVKLRWVRSDRAKKLARYLNLRAAAKMRSLVSWGMESATLERLMTRETVAGESARCSASFLRLMGRRAARPLPSPDGLGFLEITRAVSHKETAGARKMLTESCLLCLTPGLTSTGKAYFIQDR